MFSQMQYRVEDGRNICQEGPVIIEGIQHYVKNGYVKCDPGLNSRSWGSTEKENTCSKCFNIPVQLEIQFNN